ncbi:MAG: transporter suffix domain-containing protein [Gimesia sp.]|nr:transporter suffix domain-containing protein [Gimesia sp.]
MSKNSEKTGWRIKIGFALFIVSIGWPLMIPVLPLFGVSNAMTATFTGVMLFAAELLLVAAVAISGKDGFAFIKSAVFGFLKSYGPPEEVSPIRYRIGLVMFGIPLLLGWLSPYLGHLLPGMETRGQSYAIASDVLLLISLFVLGGSFWDKLHSLFRPNAYVVFPDKVHTLDNQD